MMIPTLNISLCFTKPVECAIALGGVLIGRHIETEAVIAIAMSMVLTPPMVSSLSPIPLHTTANTGTNSAVVAVLLMKFDSMEEMLDMMDNSEKWISVKVD